MGRQIGMDVADDVARTRGQVVGRQELGQLGGDVSGLAVAEPMAQSGEVLLSPPHPREARGGRLPEVPGGVVEVQRSDRQAGEVLVVQAPQTAGAVADPRHLRCFADPLAERFQRRVQRRVVVRPGGVNGCQQI